MRTPPDPDDVRPALQRAEADLARHLAEACDEHDRENIGDESTDELLQLEEELLAAARAADEAVRLRRKLAEEGKQAVGRPVPEPADAPTIEPQGSRLRQFRTASGSEWRVWEVRPGAAARVHKVDLYPADYAHGWLAFESVQGERRKRLPSFNPDWRAVADADLESLLDQAVEVPKRKRPPPDRSQPGSGD